MKKKTTSKPILTLQEKCDLDENVKSIKSVGQQEADPDFRHPMPEDIKQILDSNPIVNEKWSSLTSLTQNEWICWVTIVKKPETRAEHLLRFVEDLSVGKRRPCCWPGCPHRRKSAGKWFK